MGEAAKNLSQDVMVGAETLRRVEASYARCLNSKDGFLTRFYEIFMDSHPDVRPRFANTDLAAQVQLLRHGLMSVFMFAENNPMGQRVLARIRDSHQRSKLNIPPLLYQYWTDSLIKAISEFDDQFDQDLERAWRRVIQPATEYIAAGYEG